jgi:hypothetical protein
MKRLLPLVLALFSLSRMVEAQTQSQSANSQNTSRSSAAASSRATVNATLQTTIDRLTQSNHDLLDLLKKQQAVLEDIQYDRRLQSRQIQSLEERLEETLLQNAQLQNKISNLETAAAVAPTPAPAAPAVATPANPAPQPTPSPVVEQPSAPPPPSTYLPPPPASEASGAESWHRIITLSGSDSRDTGLFHIDGSTWRVLWHNLDKPGTAYQNTSALFINAFPKDDTIPQKVCSKLGTGGDSAELIGPGNYYLKIEASGGSWELAVEDFH